MSFTGLEMLEIYTSSSTLGRNCDFKRGSFLLRHPSLRDIKVIGQDGIPPLRVLSLLPRVDALYAAASAEGVEDSIVFGIEGLEPRTEAHSAKSAWQERKRRLRRFVVHS